MRMNNASERKHNWYTSIPPPCHSITGETTANIIHPHPVSPGTTPWLHVPAYGSRGLSSGRRRLDRTRTLASLAEAGAS